MHITKLRVLGILVAGGILFAAVSIIEFIIRGVFGYVLFDAIIGPGFGVPVRFFTLSLFGSSDDHFIARAVFDWMIWSIIAGAVYLRFIARRYNGNP